MKTLLKIVGGVVVILLLNFLINLLFVSKNKSKDFVETYIKESKKIKIRVDSNDFSGKFTHVSYFKGTVFLKGLYGNSQDAYKGITNFILKGQAEDLIEALQKEEASARAKITLIAGKD